jgi:lysophospholipase L1-like esterase
VAAVSCFAALELFLRAFHHHVLPQVLSNEIASGYHTGWNGIYAYDPEANCDLPKPGYARRMYYNGYWWEHRSDSGGFRNPTDRSQVDVVLLGDSMVYGHGLEEPDTIRHQLEVILGLPVANLGMQGASSHQEYQIAKRYVAQLRPRYVFLFFLFNDIADLTGYLTDEEMLRFLRAPRDARSVDYFDRYEPAGSDALAAILRGSYAARALSVLAELVRRDLAQLGLAHGEMLPPAFVTNPRMALALLFHELAVTRMKLIASDHGARFVNVFVYTGQSKSEAFYEEVLGRWCAENSIDVLDLRQPLSSAMAKGVEVYLERDGHFSAGGARVVAEALADWIRDAEAFDERAHEAPTAADLFPRDAGASIDVR